MTLYRTALSHRIHTLTLTGAAALAFIAAGPARPALAAPAATGLTIGSVDIGKLQTQSTRKAKYDADLHAMADRLDAAFKQQAASVMLTPADQTELGTLLSKPRPTDSDRARITALQTQATQTANELIALQQKKDPTPADTARLGTLNDMYAGGQKTLQGIGDGYQAQLKKLSDDDNAAFTASVKEAINAVAQQRGLSVVFTSDIAVYTSNDITDEVIKRVNK